MRAVALLVFCCAAIAAAQPEEGPPPMPPPHVPREATKSAPQAAAARSAGRGAFGIGAGFGAASVVYGGGAGLGTLSGLGVLSSPAAAIGISVFTGQHVKLLVDAQLTALGLNNRPLVFSGGARFGIDFVLRSQSAALRPLVHVGAGLQFLSSSLSTPAVTSTLALQGGFGAEYFFAPEFAVNVRLLAVIPIGLVADNIGIGLSLVPTFNATWYL